MGAPFMWFVGIGVCWFTVLEAKRGATSNDRVKRADKPVKFWAIIVFKFIAVIFWSYWCVQWTKAALGYPPPGAVQQSAQK